MFKQKGVKIIKEGRFIWNDPDKEFEHYTSTDWMKKTVQFNRTYYWIVC